ncbi:hypothetical protein KY317_02830, partial [Candidatus Woesearchaeota archaeon]|nr:hypothetical protein [Candidatus Woesearchaeota archaeon]
FIDKIQRKELRQIDVSVICYNSLGINLLFPLLGKLEYYVEVRADKTNLKLNRYKERGANLVNSFESGRRLDSEKLAFEEAVRIAEKLQKQNLGIITINRYPVEGIKKMIKWHNSPQYESDESQ